MSSLPRRPPNHTTTTPAPPPRIRRTERWRARNEAHLQLSENRGGGGGGGRDRSQKRESARYLHSTSHTPAPTYVLRNGIERGKLRGTVHVRATAQQHTRRRAEVVVGQIIGQQRQSNLFELLCSSHVPSTEEHRTGRRDEEYIPVSGRRASAAGHFQANAPVRFKRHVDECTIVGDEFLERLQRVIVTTASW